MAEAVSLKPNNLQELQTKSQFDENDQSINGVRKLLI